MIIIGIITLILGIVLSSIPWLDYFILKVSPVLAQNSSVLMQYLISTELKAVERYIKLPLLAEARGYTTDQGLHLQCDQSGRVPQRREAQAAGGWSLCLQVSSTHYLVNGNYYFLSIRTEVGGKVVTPFGSKLWILRLLG